MEIHHFNIRHLRAMLAICQLGSISAAAQAINLSQPAVTQGIARLEHQIGRPLFERRSDGMEPTRAGDLLALRVDAALKSLATGFRTARGTGMSGGFAQADRLVTMAQLRAMIALTDAGSYISASVSTGLSQPSIHRAIRELETASGLPLFERRGRGVAISEAGRIVVRAFRLARAALQAGLSDIAALDGVDLGCIAIGAMPLGRAKILPRAIARFHAAHPEVQIDIIDGPHAELIEKLRDGDVDFLLGALREPHPGKDVEQRRLFDDRLVIATRAGHPLTQTSHTPDMSDLSAYPWVIARPRTPMRAIWENMFSSAGMTPPAAPVTCGSVMAIRALLLEGDYLTLLSPDQVARDVDSGLIATIGEPITESSRPIGITTRAGWQPTKAQAEFLGEVEKAII